MTASGSANLSDAAGTRAHKVGLFACVAFAVGSMVGGGVFALSGIVVNDVGPGAMISFLAAGVIVMLSALSFAAVSSRARPGASGYEAIGRELGPIWRFVAMWGFYVVGITAMAFVLIAFGSYLRYFLTQANALVLSVIAALILMLLNFGAASLVGKAETVLVVFKVAVLVILVGFGVAAFSPDHFAPFLPHGTGAVLSATSLLFSAYAGFSVITNMAGVVKDPQRTVPLAIILSILIVAAIYIGVTLALITSGEKSFGDAALSEAAKALIGPAGGVLVAVTAVVSTLSGANANLLGSSELMLHMAANGDIPSTLGRLTKHGHAVMSVTISSAIVLALLLTGDIESIIKYCSVTWIIAMVIVNATAFRMGWQHWSTPGLRLPGRWVLPALAIITSLSQLPSLGWRPVLVGSLLIASGFVFYAFRHHSHPAHLDAIKQRIARQDTPLLRIIKPNASTPPPDGSHPTAARSPRPASD